MLEILAFIFRDFWTFVGVLCLITVIGVSIAMPISALTGGNVVVSLFGTTDKHK